MKKTSIFVMFLALGLFACSDSKPGDSEFLTVDVTAYYPPKDIVLQDFMDVEYVPLETSDEFLVKGNCADVGKNILVVTNVREGDILLFDRATGKGIKKINRQGKGPEEYILPFNVYLNKEEDELIVNDGPTSKIQVYDLEGNYKKTISYKPGALVSGLHDYDTGNFLVQDIYAMGNESSTSSFFLMSKQNGSRKDIIVPYEKRISPIITKVVGDRVFFRAPECGFIASYQGDWILSEPSADTIYRHNPIDGNRPFIVRTPSVQQMDPEVFLFPGILTNRYYFMQTVTKECDVEKEDSDMPKVNLVYDKEDGKIYKYKVYNADFNGREENLIGCALDNSIAFSDQLMADELKEAEVRGKLKGELKQIASVLHEDDNPVIMLVKYKE